MRMIRKLLVRVALAGLIWATTFSSHAADARNVNLLGGLVSGGTTQAAAISGNFAYVGTHKLLLIFNIANKNNPYIIAKLDMGQLRTNAITLDGQYLYLGHFGAISICDISNPASPTIVWQREFTSLSTINGIDVKNNYLYFTSDDQDLDIYNIFDPTAPTEVGGAWLPDYANDVAVNGNYAYVANGDHGLRIFDISDPANPTQVGLYNTPGFSSGVKIMNDHAFVADGSGGLRIIDVSDPTLPDEEGFFVTTDNAVQVALSSNHAYVATIQGIRNISISNLSSPSEVGHFDAYGQNEWITFDSNYVYTKETHGGLGIINVTDPSTPTEAGNFQAPIKSTDIAVSGEYAFITDFFTGFRVVDMSNSNSFKTITTIADYNEMTAIDIAGNYAYFTQENVFGISGGPGLRIYDIATPSLPSEVGFYSTRANAKDVYLTANYAYVVDGLGLGIINITSPSSPVEEGYWQTPGEAISVSVYGQYAFVADSLEGLRIININNPTTPFEVSYYTNARVIDVAVSSNYAYLASDDLIILDISDPLIPIELGRFEGEPSSLFTGITVYGNYAMVIDNQPRQTLRVINIVNPALPVEDGYYKLLGDYIDNKSNLIINNNKIYAAEEDMGFEVFEFIAPPPTPTPTITPTFTVSPTISATATNTAITTINDAVTIKNRLYRVNQSDPITINYGMTRSGPITIKIYNRQGRLVKKLIDHEQQEGNYSVEWAAKNTANQVVASGVYVVRIQTPTFTKIQKVVVVK